MTQVLLEEYNANPNVISQYNRTSLWFCSQTGNLSLLKLLVQHGFDFVNLVNVCDSKKGMTPFHWLCYEGHTYMIKHLFGICQEIAKCSINILARNRLNMCGLHYAIQSNDVECVKYLLENVYFPNRDKMNQNGVEVINSDVNNQSLAAFATNDSNLEIFKLLVEYGMDVSTPVDPHRVNGVVLHAPMFLIGAIFKRKTEIVRYWLDARLHKGFSRHQCISLISWSCKWKAKNILQILYDYGRKTGVISDDCHIEILKESSKSSLDMFKATLSMLLAQEGINDVNKFPKSKIINTELLYVIVDAPHTSEAIKMFIHKIVASEWSETESKQANEGNLTCINGHEIPITYYNNIQVSGKCCSICNDDFGTNTQSLHGLECPWCMSLICEDCIVVQMISNSINENTDNMNDMEEVMHYMAILQKILQSKDNKRLFGKVEYISLSIFSIFVCCGNVIIFQSHHD